MLMINVFALVYALIVTGAVTLASGQDKNHLYYTRTAILFIPIFAQLRQVLVISGLIEFVPFYLFIAYFLLRMLGPLINWHIHAVIGRKVNYWNGLHILTYLVLAFTVFKLFNFLVNYSADSVMEAIHEFKSHSWYAYTYPVIQLAHVIQAVWLLMKHKVEDRHRLMIKFMKIMTAGAIVALLVLQLGYFVFERQTVEFILAPLIFFSVYSVLVFISIRYSALYDTHELARKPQVLGVLSQRENQVLRLIAEGKTDKKIAEELFLSTHTIATYCRRIYEKLEVSNRTEAANHYSGLAR